METRGVGHSLEAVYALMGTYMVEQAGQGAGGSEGVGSPSSASSSLGDLGQGLPPLWASVCSSVKWGRGLGPTSQDVPCRHDDSTPQASTRPQYQLQIQAETALWGQSKSQVLDLWPGNRYTLATKGLKLRADELMEAQAEPRWEERAQAQKITTRLSNGTG